MGNQTTFSRIDSLRILIDAAALSPAAPQWLQAWWSNILPLLIEQLNEHEIWILDRNPFNTRVSGSAVHRLTVPAVDRGDLTIEDRRLAALYHELAVDCFLSTYATSAGGHGRTLLVLPPKRPWVVASHHRVALRLASGFIVFSSIGRSTLRRFGIGEGDLIAEARAPGLEGPGTGRLGHAKDLAQALIATASHTTRGPALERRSKTELTVESAARTLRLHSQHRLARSFRRSTEVSPGRRFVNRVLRAFKNPTVAARKVADLIMSRPSSS